MRVHFPQVRAVVQVARGPPGEGHDQHDARERREARVQQETTATLRTADAGETGVSEERLMQQAFEEIALHMRAACGRGRLRAEPVADWRENAVDHSPVLACAREVEAARTQRGVERRMAKERRAEAGKRLRERRELAREQE